MNTFTQAQSPAHSLEFDRCAHVQTRLLVADDSCVQVVPQSFSGNAEGDSRQARSNSDIPWGWLV